MVLKRDWKVETGNWRKEQVNQVNLGTQGDAITARASTGTAREPAPIRALSAEVVGLCDAAHLTLSSRSLRASCVARGTSVSSILHCAPQAKPRSSVAESTKKTGQQWAQQMREGGKGRMDGGQGRRHTIKSIKWIKKSSIHASSSQSSERRTAINRGASSARQRSYSDRFQVLSDARKPVFTSS